MVTYEEIYSAFCVYAASRSAGDWRYLWILCQRRMEPLVKSKAKGLTAPLDRGDLNDLVTDSVARVIAKMVQANDVTPGFISKTFFYENLHAFTAYNRGAAKWRRMTKAATMLNSARHVQ